MAMRSSGEPPVAVLPRAVHVAVGQAAPEHAQARTLERGADRRAVLGRLREAALRAALANLSLWGLVVIVASLLIAAALPFDLFTALWALSAGSLGALAWWWPRVLVHRAIMSGPSRDWAPIQRALVVFVALVVLAMAIAPWLARLELGEFAPALRSLWVVLPLAAVVLVGAAALAPVRNLDLFLYAVPASATLANLGWPLTLPDLFGVAVQVLVALSILVVSRQRNRHWRQNTRALIEQGDRIRQLEQERDEAARSDAEKSRFLAIASHDLRQPVHALALFTATLHRRLSQSPEEPLVRNMVRALDGLERSFNALLDISRLDAGTLAPTLQTFSLRDLFRRLHMHYGGQAELAGLGLRFSPGGKSVHSDPQMLERVLGNLVQNAIKYTERGGIVVVARTTSRFINVEVWDTGSGIAADKLPRIFDEFYQIGRGERDRSHGLGMGLAIVKRLVRSLGHELTVSSQVGKGTVFRVSIPTANLSGMHDAMAPADTVPQSIDRPQMVLVIDDEEPIREGLRGLLHEWGYQAMTAATAAQAEHVTQALEGRVDLILSDLHLGGDADGLEAIERVQLRCRHVVPAILITGDTAQGEIRRIAASGHMVLFKPVQPRRLYEALREHTGGGPG